MSLLYLQDFKMSCSDEEENMTGCCSQFDLWLLQQVIVFCLIKIIFFLTLHSE